LHITLQQASVYLCITAKARRDSVLRYTLCNRSSETFATTLNNSPQSLPSWDAALKETLKPRKLTAPRTSLGTQPSRSPPFSELPLFGHNPQGNSNLKEANSPSDLSWDTALKII